MVTHVTDEETMTDIVQDLPSGTYLIMTKKPNYGGHRNTIARKESEDTWVEREIDPNGGEHHRTYSDNGVARGILAGGHYWAFS